jgi:hypothetical protein
MKTPNAEAQQVLTMMAEAASTTPPTPSPINAYDMVRACRAPIRSMAALKQEGSALFDVCNLSFAQDGRTIGLRIYRPAEGVLPAGVWCMDRSLVPESQLA